MEWVDRFADEVIAQAGRVAPGKVIVCASGLSPSGPIHLGNLREVMTPHLVADVDTSASTSCLGTTMTGSGACRRASTRHGPSTSASR